MALALGVGEVVALGGVEGEAELALEGAEVVLEEVGVLVEVDGFEGEFAEALLAVGGGLLLGHDAAAAELGAGAVLEVDAAAEAEGEAQGGAGGDAVVAEGFGGVVEGGGVEGEALAVRRHGVDLVLDGALEVVDRVAGLHVEGDGAAGEGAEEDLHGNEGRLVLFWFFVCRGSVLSSREDSLAEERV